MIRKALLFLFIVLILLLLWYFPLISYGVKQGIGQLRIVWNARPIEEVIHNPDIDENVKEGLKFIREVVEFGVKEIGLEDEGNYQTFYDQGGKPLLFVVTGAAPFELKPYEWKFPVVGVVPYKGFFNPEDAKKERQKLLDLGFDADIRNPGGWSTLGWFKDPVLSSMLERSRGDIANTILHELTHATIFVKDSIEYNENLASFIGYEAALLFMEFKYGKESKELKEYIHEEEDFQLYVEHILKGADKLDSLYKNMGGMDEYRKQELKSGMINEILAKVDTLNFHNPERYKWKRERIPDNTYFMSFLRYRSQQGDFKTMLEEDFNNNLKSFVKHLQKQYSYL